MGDSRGTVSDLRSGPRDGTEGPDRTLLRQAVATEGPSLVRPGGLTRTVALSSRMCHPRSSPNIPTREPTFQDDPDREAVRPDSQDEGLAGTE